MGHDFVVVHYAEIGTKGKNRAIFERQLARNIRKAMEGLDYESVERAPGRLLVRLTGRSDWKRIRERLGRVFGIAYSCPAWSSPSTMKAMENKAVEVMGGRKGSFRISASRAWKQFRAGSQKVNEKIGAAVVREHGLKVSLGKPRNTLTIEILKGLALLSLERAEGPGGLPVGVSGKVLCLLSGGIDSPVAAVLMMKRGCEVELVHFHNEVGGGLAKMKDMVKALEKYQPDIRMHVVPFRKLQNQVIAKVKADYRMIVYRRFMFRIAEMLAGRVRAKAIATGESIGQVASQTLDNIRAIEDVSSVPVMRPLLAMDKKEIVELAKKYGTYEISIRPYQDCCSFMIAAHPQTHARAKDVERMERGMDAAKMAEEALSGATVFKH